VNRNPANDVITSTFCDHEGDRSEAVSRALSFIALMSLPFGLNIVQF
jgi:hypothetical protein